MSSAALGKLITLHNKAKAASGEARMCCIHPNIFEVFKITQLDRLFLIHSTREDALKAFGAA
jgi:anti-sigma B factor antagonist